MTKSLMADPNDVVAKIITDHGDDRGWLDAFADAFEKRRHAQPLARVLAVWDMNQTDAAAAFGVTRQAISKWLASGPPPDRAVPIADLAAATDLLVRHITRDRIPAIVRRPAANLGGRSLVELLTASGASAVLEASRAMFAFERAQR